MHREPRERLKALLTPEVVECLDELFPDRCPDPAATDRLVWISVGSVRVVRLLKAILEEVAEENHSNRK